MKFFVCEKCGNFVEMVKESGAPMMCCGEKMKELVPGTSDGAVEKHVPVVNVEGNKVTVNVGSAEHPMVDAHSASLRPGNPISLMVMRMVVVIFRRVSPSVPSKSNIISFMLIITILFAKVRIFICSLNLIKMDCKDT